MTKTRESLDLASVTVRTVVTSTRTSAAQDHETRIVDMRDGETMTTAKSAPQSVDAGRDRDLETVTETMIDGDDIGVTDMTIVHRPGRGQGLRIIGSDVGLEAGSEDEVATKTGAEKGPLTKDREVATGIVQLDGGEMVDQHRDHVHLVGIEERIDGRTGSLRYSDDRCAVSKWTVRRSR